MNPSLLFRAVVATVLIAVSVPSLGKIQYQFPSNSATAISRTTTIIIRPGDPINPKTVSSSLITAKGAFSGNHTGTFVLSDDKKTLVFTPSYAFTYSERVTVTLKSGIKTTAGKAVDAYSFYFTIQPKPTTGKKTILSQPEPIDETAISFSKDVSSQASITMSAVYPNPTRNEANISINLDKALSTRIVIYNSAGEQVALVNDGLLEAGHHNFAPDISIFPNGAYHVVLIANGESRTAAFVVAK